MVLLRPGRPAVPRELLRVAAAPAARSRRSPPSSRSRTRYGTWLGTSSGVDAGVHVAPGDAAGVVEAIEDRREHHELAAEQGTNVRAAFEAHFAADGSVEQHCRMLVGRPASTEGTTDQ